MSTRILHLASLNYLLKNEYTNFTIPDPLALVNVGDLIEMRAKQAAPFLKNVLEHYMTYSPFDDIAIRTAVSCAEEEQSRLYRLYLNPREIKENAYEAFKICRKLVELNPAVKPSDFWLVFAISTPEMFSGNVCSDYYWPNKVLAELTAGPFSQLAYGEISRPESYVLDVRTGDIEYREGSNSPVLSKFLGRDLKMDEIIRLMQLASRMPCILEFIYGLIRKLARSGPLIFDIRVPKGIRWKFFNTNVVWETNNGHDFLCKFNLICKIAMQEGLPLKKEISTLITGPEGALIETEGKQKTVRQLFEIDIFSPVQRTIRISTVFPEAPATLNNHLWLGDAHR